MTPLQRRPRVMICAKFASIANRWVHRNEDARFRAAGRRPWVLITNLEFEQAPTNALAFGQFLGARYRDRSNLIRILGGDKAPSTPEAVAVWRALAQGISGSVSGHEDDDRVLMTDHTSGLGHVSDFIHDEPWLDFTSAQSSHGNWVESWRFIEKHWSRQPVKPVIDLESKAWWFDPRTGQTTAVGQFAREGEREFIPPGEPGVGNDWVLLLDDPQRGFDPPQATVSTTRSTSAPLPFGRARGAGESPHPQWGDVGDGYVQRREQRHIGAARIAARLRHAARFAV